MPNAKLTAARKAKNDEFYTQLSDIESEMNAYLERDADLFRGKVVLLPCDDPEWSNFTKFFTKNFTKYGIKKLISTCYSNDGRGKKQVVTRAGVTNSLLGGDGDFRSDEVTALLGEADIVITNPPFSLFRDFMAWMVEANKKFAVIGNMNAVICKEVFPLIKENKIWMGATNFNTGMYFRVPENFVYASTYKFKKKQGDVKVSRVSCACWFTNIEHGRRHEPLPLVTEACNRTKPKYAKLPRLYKKYDNYDAIEVPFVDAIPGDYTGVMGVPVTFLDKYNPDQFEIVGSSSSGLVPDEVKLRHFVNGKEKRHNEPFIAGKGMYSRIFVKHRDTGVAASSID